MVMQIKRVAAKKWLYGCLIFLTMFGPKFGAFIDIIPITCLVLLVTNTFKTNKIVGINHTAILIAAYGIYSLFIIAIMNGVYDQWHIFQPWRALINYLGIVLIVKLMFDAGWNWRQVLSMVNISIYVHSLIVILTFLIPDLKYALFDLTGFIEKSYLRSPGLTHSYGITSILTAMPFILVYFVKNSLFSVKYDYLGLVVVFISLFLLARVGLYLVPFLIFILLAVIIFMRRFRFKYIAIIFTIIFTVYFSFQYLVDMDTELLDGTGTMMAIFFNESIWHSLELVVAYLDGNYELKSFEEIGSFDYHNETVLEYLFGTGEYGRGDRQYYLYTDISYAHFFSMVGIFGIILLILIQISPYFIFFKSAPPLRFVFLILTVVILVTNYKEATFFTRNLFSLWCYFSACLYWDHKSKYKRGFSSKNTSINNLIKVPK
ncbi:hypothetical protein [uncultured Gammaproteobacteria bacterium]|nr:hypothetical protein [uncultured Gammaproteobacteria bacterium]